MKKTNWYGVGVGVLAFVVFFIILPWSKSRSPSSVKTPKAVVEGKKGVPTGEQWNELTPINIKIPENIGGEAKLTRNIYFIMDGSGSMNERTTSDCGGDQEFTDKITGARWAIKKFLENVPEDVNIGLYVFDFHGRREVVPLGASNREAFISAVDDIEASGTTPLAEAIRFGTDQLVQQYKKQLGYGEFRLVVVTDGIAEGIPEAAIYAARRGIPIYAIGLCVEVRHPLRHFSVSYRAADSFEDLKKGLEETLAELPSFDVTEFQEQKTGENQ
jgi:Ca-activated chloride channel family protein